MKRKKGGKFSLFPSIVSNNPKKVIVVILVFTLIMGYFASQMEMGTEQESFNPESEKADYLSEINNKFGSSGVAIQIAFVADDGNVFTKEVLIDMLDTKRALIDNSVVNETLVSSNNIPSGINTLADSILMANQTLRVERAIIDYSEQTDDILNGVKTQKEMYLLMNQSLSSSVYLIQQQNPKISQNASKSLKGMASIIAEPNSWATLRSFEDDFTNLMYNLSNPSISIPQKIQQTEKLISKLQLAKTVPGTQHFIYLLDGMNGVLRNSQNPQYIESAIGMTINFLRIGEKLGSINTGISNDASDSFPSLELSEEEKRERLDNMTDDDIKNTVRDVLIYDSQHLNNSVDEAIINFQRMETNASEGISVLTSVNETLSQLIAQYTQQGDLQLAQQVAGYQQSVVINKTILQQSQEMFEKSKDQFESAYFVPSVINGMEKSIRLTVSKDFEQNINLHQIEAKSTLALVQMNSSLNKDIRLKAQKEIIDVSKNECENSDPKVFAQQIMVEQINESANRSMNTLLPIAFAFVVIILFIVYRSIAETAVSILSLGFAIIWTFGIGVLLGYEFNPMIIAVPILITGLVIDYGIHMVLRVREERDDDKNPEMATIIAISTVGGALFLTTITTAIGFLSNLFSNIQVMRNFGILAGVGILSSFILMVGFLPAIVQILEKWRKGREKKRSRIAKKVKRQGSDIISNILSSSADASDKHPWVVLFVVLLITVASVYGAVNIDTKFNIRDFLPEDRSQSENIEYIGDNFNVSTSYAYVLTKGELDTSEYLHAVDETTENMADDEMLISDDGLNSVLSVIRQYGTAPTGSSNYNSTIVQIFSNSDTDDDLVPENNITELYDLLFENPNSKKNIESVLLKDSSGDYSTAIIKVKENANKITENIDNADIMENEMNKDIKPLEEAGFTAEVTSSSIIGQDTTEELSETQITSLIATIIIVALILTIVFYYLYKSLALGLITTLPVTVVTLWIIGTMYMMGVSLNVMTVSITALTVGMGVDYSIHITHRFNEERGEEDNLYDAIHDTVQHTGGALFGSAATTVGAFAILSTSEILPLAQFGYITALAISYSFLVAVFVLPSGLMLWAKYRDKKELPKKKKAVLKKKPRKEKPVLKKREKKNEGKKVLKKREK